MKKKDKDLCHAIAIFVLIRELSKVTGKENNEIMQLAYASVAKIKSQVDETSKQGF